MVSHKDYVAGWLDSSIHDVLQAFPHNSESMEYALITCLDSCLEPSSLLDQSPELLPVKAVARSLGKGLLLPTKLLQQANSQNQIFFGFDEVWFFSSDKIDPKPDSAWLVGPARIGQEAIEELGEWMANNSCSLALGDGVGLNFIIKARGPTKLLLSQSIVQPEPNVTFVASPTSGATG
jgi:hypothetical protein